MSKNEQKLEPEPYYEKDSSEVEALFMKAKTSGAGA